MGVRAEATTRERSLHSWAGWAWWPVVLLVVVACSRYEAMLGMEEKEHELELDKKRVHA